MGQATDAALIPSRAHLVLQSTTGAYSPKEALHAWAGAHPGQHHQHTHPAHRLGQPSHAVPGGGSTGCTLRGQEGEEGHDAPQLDVLHHQQAKEEGGDVLTLWAGPFS